MDFRCPPGSAPEDGPQHQFGHSDRRFKGHTSLVRAPSTGAREYAFYGYGPYLLYRTLRGRIGDEAWLSAVKLLAERHHEGFITTEDVQAAFEESSGRELDAFFDFWVHGGLLPAVQLDYRVVEEGGSQRVELGLSGYVHGNVLKVQLGIAAGDAFAYQARTFLIGSRSLQDQEMVRVAAEALAAGVSECRPGRQVAEVSRALGQRLEAGGLSANRLFVGHRMAETPHLDPQIPVTAPKRMPKNGRKLKA